MSDAPDLGPLALPISSAEPPWPDVVRISARDVHPAVYAPRTPEAERLARWAEACYRDRQRARDYAASLA